MIEVNKEELRRLAEESQQWGEEIGESEWYGAGSFQKPFFGGPDAQFIAAANPAAILSLLDENRALLEQVATLQSDANSWQSGYDKGREMGGKHRASEVDQLRSENERIRRELTAFRNNTSISGSQIEWIDQILGKERNANG